MCWQVLSWEALSSIGISKGRIEQVSGLPKFLKLGSQKLGHLCGIMRNLEPSWGDKMQNDQPHGGGFMSPMLHSLCCQSSACSVRSGEGNGDALVAKCHVCTLSYTSCNVSVSPRSTRVLRHGACPSAWNPLGLQWAFPASAGLFCAGKHSTNNWESEMKSSRTKCQPKSFYCQNRRT